MAPDAKDLKTPRTARAAPRWTSAASALQKAVVPDAKDHKTAPNGKGCTANDLREATALRPPAESPFS